jgi:hypothetical protein
MSYERHNLHACTSLLDGHPRDGRPQVEAPRARGAWIDAQPPAASMHDGAVSVAEDDDVVRVARQ